MSAAERARGDIYKVDVDSPQGALDERPAARPRRPAAARTRRRRAGRPVWPTRGSVHSAICTWRKDWVSAASPAASGLVCQQFPRSRRFEGIVRAREKVGSGKS